MANQKNTHIRRAQIADQIFASVAWVVGLSSALLPLIIIGFLFKNGGSVISWEFLTDRPRGLPLGNSGGIKPAIQGSLALVAIGLVISAPTAIAAAAYMSEFNTSSRILRTFRFVAECLAGIPSIVYGLFGYAFLVVFLSLKISLLAGGITLGLVMFPILLVGMQESMDAVDIRYREAALALGVTRSNLLRRVIIPRSWAGIVSIIVLATGHAFGTAAPVLLTASVIFGPDILRLDAPVMTLPTHLYYLVGEAISFDHAFGTALVLVLIVLIFNLLAGTLKKFFTHQ